MNEVSYKSKISVLVALFFRVYYDFYKYIYIHDFLLHIILSKLNILSVNLSHRYVAYRVTNTRLFVCVVC